MSPSETRPRTAAGDHPALDRSRGELAQPAPPLEFPPVQRSRIRSEAVAGRSRLGGPTHPKCPSLAAFLTPSGSVLRVRVVIFRRLTLIGFHEVPKNLPFRALFLPKAGPARHRTLPSSTFRATTAVPLPVVPDWSPCVPEGLFLPRSRSPNLAHVAGRARGRALLVVPHLRGTPSAGLGLLRTLPSLAFL